MSTGIGLQRGEAIANPDILTTQLVRSAVRFAAETKQGCPTVLGNPDRVLLSYQLALANVATSWRRRNFWIFPVAVVGSSLTTITFSGIFCIMAFRSF